MLRQRNTGRDDGGAVPTESSFSTRQILKKVDVYPKLHREFKVQTEAGATVSLVAMVIMAILFLSELRDFLTVSKHEHMVVDTSTTEKLQITFDISYPALTCREAHMNAMDVAGDLQVNMHHTVFKTRLAADGTPIGEAMTHVPNAHPETLEPLPADYCGSCYGNTHPSGLTCCNTCDQVKEAFMTSDKTLDDAESTEQCLRERGKEEVDSKNGEGCRLHGSMFVNRVAGNFHVGLGRTFHREGRLVHQFLPGQQFTYNSSHIIHEYVVPYPGMKGPLDNVAKTADRVFFIFELSAFVVQVDATSVPFTHFLMRVCAIVGGMVSIAGFVDSLIYHYFKKSPSSSTSSAK
ncbi:hypothetical protein DYB25_008806 [Aphanomyces astaci]|uniref:Endoplasmic reticulum vesicle transporter C-terminal domain-containing protein n=2 Tax=Aphanomyces astaci TaxID=112090 RepID=A0A397AHK0_APHAT|nr:hypothetical protein DYB25_008806 [Aphanomyces astaci]RHY65229.1 hypothetical protein DYB38_008322 [Aphanomyces astaci]